MPPQGLDVWRADVGDVGLLSPLFDAYRGFYGRPSDPDLCRRYLTDRLSRGESVVFLAGVRGGSAVGFVQMYPTFGSLAAARVFILYDLFVAPEARQNGVGRLLMERAHRHAQETGARSIVLETARTNHAAQKLYESLGYKRDDQFLTYELTLPAPPS
jgi:ribosomal protein S18 acetylase RimI-like enzyme